MTVHNIARHRSIPHYRPMQNSNTQSRLKEVPSKTDISAHRATHVAESVLHKRKSFSEEDFPSKKQRVSLTASKATLPAHKIIQSTHTNQVMNTGEWSSKETNLLREAVEQYGEKNWLLVAEKVGTRDNRQCRTKWVRGAKPDFNRGKWSLAEDKRLMNLVKIYGTTQWTSISKEMNRNDLQCRCRWLRTLNPDLSHGRWSKDEDRRLQETIQKCGIGHWAEIALDMGNRSDSQCHTRWNYLHKKTAKTISTS